MTTIGNTVCLESCEEEITDLCYHFYSKFCPKTTNKKLQIIRKFVEATKLFALKLPYVIQVYDTLHLMSTVL